MPKSKMTAAALADVCARLINRESKSSIQRLTGMGGTTIDKIIVALQKHGLALEGHPAHRFDPEREVRLHDLFKTTTLSNRQIVAETGVALSTVNKSRERFNVALVQAGGELPRCDCGQYLHHPRMCWARLHDTMKRSGVASVHTLEPEKKADVHRRLMMGQTARSIAERIGLTKALVQAYLRTLTSEERQQREAAFRTSAGRRRAAKAAKKIARPHAINPASDPLYAEISAAVPRAIDPALRDDMISQAYLEVLEGRLTKDRLAAGVKKVRGRIFQAFANPWGNLSLDAVLGDEAGRSMIERIPADASAFA